jgi:hypothetical protein
LKVIQKVENYLLYSGVVPFMVLNAGLIGVATSSLAGAGVRVFFFAQFHFPFKESCHLSYSLCQEVYSADANTLNDL